MSCVVALIEAGVIYMGGDSIVVGGDSKTISRATKVFKRDNMLIGTCGSVRMRNLLQYDLIIPVYPGGNVVEYLVKDFVNAVRDCFKRGGLATEKQGREKGGIFLLGFQDELFYVDYDYDLGTPAERYYAIGCADDIANGSFYSTEQLDMEPLRRVELALQAAERHNTDVSGPFTFITSQEGID